MRIQWKSVGMMAVLALFLGIAAPAWSQPVVVPPPTAPLADPMAEDYTAHVIPFYKIDANWFAYLVIADTSFQDLAPGGTPIFLTFYDAACNFVSDATLRPTQGDAQFFALHDETDADGQFNGIPKTGVVLLDGRASRFLTYILLVNANNSSLLRIDSIPCQGPLVTLGAKRPCSRGLPGGSTWLRYDTYNTIAATFGDTDTFFNTNLYFFSAVGDLRAEMLQYGAPRHGDWAGSIHVDGYCDEVYLGSRRLDLECTKRVRLDDLRYTRLNVWPNADCAGQPGHIETYASNNGTDPVNLDYSGFQETIATLVPGINIIGTGYYHHSEESVPARRPVRPSSTSAPTP